VASTHAPVGVGNGDIPERALWTITAMTSPAVTAVPAIPYSRGCSRSWASATPAAINDMCSRRTRGLKAVSRVLPASMKAGNDIYTK